MDEEFTADFEEDSEEIPEREPHGFRRWAIRAASALGGPPCDHYYEAEDRLLERLAPGLATRIVAEEEGADYPEDPAEIARHLVYTLHNAIGFARVTELHLVVEVSPSDPDGVDPDEGEELDFVEPLVEPEDAGVHVFTPMSDVPELGFAITEYGILQEGQRLLAEKEEPISTYECRNALDLRNLHEKLYLWMPVTRQYKEQARAQARRLEGVVEEMLDGLDPLEEAAVEMDLEDEIDTVKGALEDLKIGLEEVSFDEEEHERFLADLYKSHTKDPALDEEHETDPGKD